MWPSIAQCPRDIQTAVFLVPGGTPVRPATAWQPVAGPAESRHYGRRQPTQVRKWESCPGATHSATISGLAVS
jgi:hypothetical protein